MVSHFSKHNRAKIPAFTVLSFAEEKKAKINKHISEKVRRCKCYKENK